MLLQVRVISKCVELAVNSSGPTRHLIVYDVHLLELLLKLIVVTILASNRLLHFQYVLVLELGISFLSSCSVGFRVDLEVVEPVPEHLVVLLEDVDLLVAVVDVLEQVRVCLLTGQEAFHQFLDVSYSSSCLNLLESGVDLSRISHFLLHLLPHEGVPELLNVQILPVLDLRLVFAVVGGLVGDLLVLLNSFHTLLDRFFLVLETFGDFG